MYVVWSLMKRVYEDMRNITETMLLVMLLVRIAWAIDVSSNSKDCDLTCQAMRARQTKETLTVAFIFPNSIGSIGARRIYSSSAKSALGEINDNKRELNGSLTERFRIEAVSAVVLTPTSPPEIRG